MTLVFPTVAIDDWLNRLFSFGLVLSLGALLTFSKAALVINDLVNRKPEPSAALSGYAEDGDEPLELPGFDEDAFVPWPSTLPEPAAGPEDGAPPDSGGQGQPAFDPTQLTEGEFLALQQLAARRKALDEREQLLDMRAELNSQVEARLDEQITRLAELKAELEALVKGLDEAEEIKLARLVKIYETMKAKAAAEIFNRLEMSVLLHVIERMKEAKSAAVLGKMDPTVAKRVTAELAKKKKRPVVDGFPSEGGV